LFFVLRVLSLSEVLVSESLNVGITLFHLLSLLQLVLNLLEILC
jgi:hypothetical protein